jgi:hypothetical protein
LNATKTTSPTRSFVGLSRFSLKGCPMKLTAERLSLDVWTVTIDGATRTDLTRDEAWSALDLAMSMSKTKEEGSEP